MTTSAPTFSQKLEDTRWTAAVEAALVAGIAFLVLECLIAALVYDASPWLPLRMIAAIALGTDVLPETGLSLGVLLAAFAIHFGLSIMSAWILAPLVQDTPVTRALIIGLGFGTVIYLVNFYALTYAFTWFIGLRGWATFLNHLAFGAILAWSYEELRRRR